MRRIHKTLLLWLLLVVLPIQGIAAAAMTSCQARSHPERVAMQPASHLHGGKSVHVHASAMAMDEHDHAAHHHDGSQAKDKHDASTSCSACASCCIGAAPLPAGLAWTSVRNSSEPVLALPSPFKAGFIPASLERPPRSTLS